MAGAAGRAAMAAGRAVVVAAVASGDRSNRGWRWACIAAVWALRFIPSGMRNAGRGSRLAARSAPAIRANFCSWPVVTKADRVMTGERVTDLGTDRVDQTWQGPGEIVATDTGLMLTRGQNIVDMNIRWSGISRMPEKYLFNLADPRGRCGRWPESSMRDIMARSGNCHRSRTAISARLPRSETGGPADDGQPSVGINVVRQPAQCRRPTEVLDSVREVRTAEQRRDALELEADAYANRASLPPRW